MNPILALSSSTLLYKKRDSFILLRQQVVQALPNPQNIPILANHTGIFKYISRSNLVTLIIGIASLIFYTQLSENLLIGVTAGLSNSLYSDLSRCTWLDSSTSKYIKIGNFIPLILVMLATTMIATPETKINLLKQAGPFVIQSSLRKFF